MEVSNINIKRVIRVGIIGLSLLAVADLVLANTDGWISHFFAGYSIFIVPAIIAGAYAYLGLPIFHFDVESEVLHIKSHMAFADVMGKELFILKKNIISFEIHTERIRKKLIVHYLKNGKEYSEKFSISLLSNKKIEELARQVDLIHTELGKRNNTHLFI